jgi:alpha-amylase/alpha-mannosidase (GH57 family)
MPKRIILLSLIVLLAVGVTACSGAVTPSSLPATQTKSEAVTEAPEDIEPLYINLIWHQHQPLYYKDADGIFTRPWVRVHATKDYYDMAATVAQYPDLKVTFNLTPVLIRQLDDFVNNGAKDKYWVLAEKPAGQLTPEDKDFLMRRFFDANWDHVIKVHPGYRDLLNKRGGTTDEEIAAAIENFSEQDFRDLQLWFNLAWFDPDELEKEPLKSMVEKDHGFSEEDKSVLFDEVRRIMSEIITIHKQLQDNGQVEIITTPYAHPILPLLYDSNLELVGNPSAEMPERFSFPNDAITQLNKSVEIYEEHFGKKPNGLWPGEGAVAEEIVPLVAKAGYRWMATGEPVLAQSLGIGSFTRDSQETVKEADDLYRPYYVQGKTGDKVAVFFRDWTLSDKVGFTYSGTPGTVAAKDLINRLENIKAELASEGAQGPHIVSIILDGENAWENYDHDGKEFLNSLYKELVESDSLQTITPTEYLARFPEQRELKDLFPGAWFSANYDTWIGEAEEKTAWNYLGQTRNDLAKYDIKKTRTTTPEALALAQDYMYLAEGSDWFWWYGSDQNSGNDAYFDEGFRALLAKVYESLGEPVPAFVNLPIIPKSPAQAEQNVKGFSSPRVDGKDGVNEWDLAAFYTSGAQAGSNLAYTFDAKNLYLRLLLNQPLAKDSTIGFYFSVPRSKDNFPFSHSLEGLEPVQLGIAASHAFVWDGGKDLNSFTAGKSGWVSGAVAGKAAISPTVFEASIPWAAFGELEAGDDLRLITGIQPSNVLLPAQGPAQIVLPDLGTSTVLLEVNDPAGDDYGQGSYTYPSDAVFIEQAYDIKSFSVAYDDKNMVFKFAFNGPVSNPWGSGNNLSIQTLDVYVDKDPGAGTGARLLLPGRNAALTQGNGWEYAVWAEGWTPQYIAPDAESLEPKQVMGVDFKIIVDPANSTVTLRVPRSAFGDGDPAKWGYVAAVLGQEGYPTTGVWRVRDVNQAAEQWRFGGAPADTNHTRIIDLVWSDGLSPTQEEMLSKYAGSTSDPGTLTPDDFAQLKLLTAR